MTKEVTTMNIFKQNVLTVISFLNSRHYSEHTVNCYVAFYEGLDRYLNQEGFGYTPEFGFQILSGNHKSFPGNNSRTLQNAAIAKLNSVYLNGEVKNVQVSPAKAYSRLVLTEEFSSAIDEFLNSGCDGFSESQKSNIVRRCRLFLKYIQSTGKTEISLVGYEDIQHYHFKELAHLKEQSRIIEESTLHQFLHFLAESGKVKPMLYLYLYALETDTFIDFVSFSTEERNAILLSDAKHMFSSEEYVDRFHTFMQLHKEAGYVDKYHQTVYRALNYFGMFLDINGLGYTPEVCDIWLSSGQTRSVFQGSSMQAAKRIFFLFGDYVLSNEAAFERTRLRGISGFKELPEWCTEPLASFASLRTKEKLDDDTVKNDIYSILRFCRFITNSGLGSYSDISYETLISFNLYDAHKTSEGKNACNARIKRFLQYLFREGLLPDSSVIQALCYVAAGSENLITVLSANEVSEARKYITKAQSPVELRDSAIFLLGAEMGIRGCDIIRLKLSDVDWRAGTIRFCQDKTDVEVELAMPVSVGNALFRYLRDGRPRKGTADTLFLSHHAPYKSLSRHVCNETLKRIFPSRNVYGSGFHVTRKTFSTSKLRNGILPEQIASAMGQQSVKSLTPYLSLDNDRMNECPLTLSSLNLSMKGAFL
jgi:site-specific recombinase XerD